MASSRFIKADTLKSIDGSSVTTSFANLGSALSVVWIQMVIKNTTNKIIQVSEDGTNAHYELQPGTSEFYDFQANRYPDQACGKQKGLQFHVRSLDEAPTIGKVILQGQYT